MLIQIVLPDFVRFQNLKHQIACIKGITVQHFKSLPIPQLWQRIHNIPEVHLQRLPNHHFGQKFKFFWRGHRQKYRPECTKTLHFKWKIRFFFWGGGLTALRPFPGGEGYSSPRRTPSSLPNLNLRLPRIQPDLHYWWHTAAYRLKNVLINAVDRVQKRQWERSGQSIQSIDYWLIHNRFTTLLNAHTWQSLVCYLTHDRHKHRPSRLLQECIIYHGNDDKIAKSHPVNFGTFFRNYFTNKRKQSWLNVLVKLACICPRCAAWRRKQWRVGTWPALAQVRCQHTHTRLTACLLLDE